MDAPRSSAGRRGQCACCASRGTRRRHRACSRIRRRRTCAVSACRMQLPGAHLQPARRRARGRDVAADEATIAWRLSERASPADRAEGAREGAGRCEHATGCGGRHVAARRRGGAGAAREEGGAAADGDGWTVKGAPAVGLGEAQETYRSNS
jgi:hypothetical protein